MADDETHFPPLDLDYGRGTQARWAINADGKLLVFVHGFNGSALTTWKGFPEQLAPHPKTHGYDLVYFGYDSVWQTIGESANQLQICLDDLLTKTVPTVNRSLSEYDARQSREKGWKYSEIVLVGHSLGACVIRRAILNQFQSGQHTWNARVRMFWFAPAHGGARIVRLLIAATVGVPLVSLDSALAFFAPVLEELKHGSDFLKNLELQANELSEKFPDITAPLTFWVWKDKVVLNKPFRGDATPYTEVRGVNHITVCKPTKQLKTVRRFLEELP